MKINLFLLLGLALLPYTTTQAQTPAAPKVVATVVSTSGNVLIENTAGQRRLAKTAMPIMQGENVFVLEKAKVQLKYAKSACQNTYPAGTLLSIDEASQCAQGRQLGTQQASAAGQQGYGAAGSRRVAGLGWGPGGLGALGSGGAAAAGLAAATVVAVAAQDNDSNTPVSP
ncbi:MAG TPA: hypothetical protein PLB10_16500 [Thiolinea sp.]|nr:hypothetical protein [Thiolinea sp.]